VEEGTCTVALNDPSPAIAAVPKLIVSSQKKEAVPGVNQLPETTIEEPFCTKSVAAKLVLFPNNPDADAAPIWLKPLRHSVYGTVVLYERPLLLSWARKTMLS
jgi:hypothetical protein